MAPLECSDCRSIMHSNAIGSQMNCTRLVAWSDNQAIEMVSMGLQAYAVLISSASNVFSPPHLVVSITVYTTSSSDTMKNQSVNENNKLSPKRKEFRRVDFVELAVPFSPPELSTRNIDHLAGSALSHASIRAFRESFTAKIDNENINIPSADPSSQSALTYFLQDSIGKVSYNFTSNICDYLFYYLIPLYDIADICNANYCKYK